MKSNLYTIIYSICLGVGCALILTFAGEFSKPYREANARAEEIRNILDVLGVPFKKDAPNEKLLEIFNKEVRKSSYGSMTVYEYIGSEGEPEPQAIAFPFAGSGVWGPIKGILALEPDIKTIKSISFYQQEETPGLGGEIASKRFRDRFKKKTIYDADGKPGIYIRKKDILETNEVQAITGATFTSNRVQVMLNSLVTDIAKGADEKGSEENGK